MIKKFVNFLKEVRSEMSRVSWPTRQELQSSTTVVIVVTCMFAVFIYIIDFILSKLFSLIFTI